MFHLLDCSPIPQFAVNVENQITYWNKACELLTGFSAAEMVGTDRHWEPFYNRRRPLVADLVLANDIKRFFSLYRHKRPGRSRIIPNAWEAYDWFKMCGRPLHVYFMAAPVYNEQGQIVGAIETLQDVSELPRSCPDCPDRLPPEQSEHLRKTSFLTADYKFGQIVGKSAAMQKVYAVLARAAGSNANVIIYGESGTGKELAARTIHQMSGRSTGNFVPVNCGAIPETLIESEFFGFRKGAFTGAVADREGFLEQADGGTLFLDEIGDISLGMQVKLLRVLEGYGFTPVGSRELKRPDLRIIGATSQDMGQLIREGKIREDFFYRIHVIPVQLPPLRERREDIPLLANHLLEQFRAQGATVPVLPDHLFQVLSDYHWPGNVRELQNVLHRYLTLNRLDFSSPAHASAAATPLPAQQTLISSAEPAGTPLPQALAAFEKELITRTLCHTRWHKSRAAALLGISRKTLFRKMRQHGIH